MTATQPLRQQNRHRSIAELDLEISRAERTRAKWSLDVEGMAVAGRDQRRAQAMLKMADERLDMLRGSRSVLIVSEPSLVQV